ncbi:ABC transporter substrate-binding protein [Microvirga sp. BT688]|uniref:ABC transporter substrate-binding protein n=1 Tax=Microvirga sp. TaxID=1873136 RepID=UPI001686E40D|nr:ABC transporter substrate-binding protein [Microvirga sp.]MBD2750898.1 ABC transporter substrate-binding protein [Microvirga sp.]
MRLLALAVTTLALLASPSHAAETRSFEDIAAKARGQTVDWNAWAGDPQTNAFITWVGAEVERRYGVKVNHVKLTDTAEAVTRVVAERAAGRNEGGGVDLIWINGPNFLAMKSQGLLYGPVTQALPNFRFVDTERRPSSIVDFTVPVEGYAVPWRVAQIVYVYDSARTDPKTLPRSIPAMLEWAKANPGRLTHPNGRNFLGATFLKQALYELAPDPSMLQKPATDGAFGLATAQLWTWYNVLRPYLWREGRSFPETGPAQRQLLADGEIDFAVSFDPAEAAVSINSGLLPDTARVMTLEKGTIGNTSFVAIPYNAADREGAMVVANFLLEPATQARAQDPKQMGSFTVLDLDKLSPDERRLFDHPPEAKGLPTNAELGNSLPEPHPSWMTRITEEWERLMNR